MSNHLAAARFTWRRRRVGFALLIALSCGPVSLQGLAAAQAKPAPQRYALRKVRMGLAEDAPVATILLENGRIASLSGADVQVPPGSLIVEGEGLIALPAFVDAFSTTGCATPTPKADQDVPVPIEADPRIDMREANRKGVQPAFRAAQVLDLPKDKSRSWREAGFGALLSAPSGQLFSGTSVLATTREAAVRDIVVSADVFAHAAFDASGPGYPGTLMGYQAQLRQLFLDARRQAELLERETQGRPGPRPPHDAELEAVLPVLDSRRRVACEADSASDIWRWIALADELGLEIAIVGGREAWRLREELATRDIPVILTLDWGEEVEDPHAKDKKKAAGKPDQEPKEQEKPEAEPEAEATAGEKPGEEAGGEAGKKRQVYEEPLAVREERRRLWEEGRDSALRLSEAEVVFAFGSRNSSATELIKRVRTLVEVGLREEAALAALTERSAAILEVGGELGALEPGRDATLALWTKSPFTKGAKLAWLFVDGFAHEFELDADEADDTPPDEGVRATGTWSLTLEGQGGARSGKLVLVMAEDGVTTGTLSTEGPDGSQRSTEVEGRVSGKKLRLAGTFRLGEVEIETTIRAEIEGDELSGESIGKTPSGEFRSSLRGTRVPERSRAGVQR